MKSTKQDVENAILFFAKKYGVEKNYEHILEFGTLPEVVNIIVYKMFLENFCYCNCSDKVYEQYRIIMEYTQELDKIGYVSFS